MRRRKRLKLPLSSSSLYITLVVMLVGDSCCALFNPMQALLVQSWRRRVFLMQSDRSPKLNSFELVICRYSVYTSV